MYCLKDSQTQIFKRNEEVCMYCIPVAISLLHILRFTRIPNSLHVHECTRSTVAIFCYAYQRSIPSNENLIDNMYQNIIWLYKLSEENENLEKCNLKRIHEFLEITFSEMINRKFRKWSEWFFSTCILGKMIGDVSQVEFQKKIHKTWKRK